MNLIDKAKDLLHDESLRGCVPDRVQNFLRELTEQKPRQHIWRENDWIPLYTLETRHD